MKLAEFNPSNEDFILENQEENQNFDIDVSSKYFNFHLNSFKFLFKFI